MSAQAEGSVGPRASESGRSEYSMTLSTAKLLMLPLLVIGALYGVRNFSGEVAVLYTTDEGGAIRSTRVWVTDHGHELWIRAVDPTSTWLDNVIRRPQVQLRRGDEIDDYEATPHAERRTRINALMAEDYGWAEWLLSRIEDREQAVPVYLDPLD